MTASSAPASNHTSNGSAGPGDGGNSSARRRPSSVKPRWSTRQRTKSGPAGLTSTTKRICTPLLPSTSRRRSEGIARDRGAAFRTACARFYGPGSHPAKPLRAAAAARGARLRTRDLSPTDRRTAEELRDTRGSRAVQVLLALAAPKKGHGAPGAGCPFIYYG